MCPHWGGSAEVADAEDAAFSGSTGFGDCGATAPVSAMLKPTLIGSAARAGTVAQRTTANKLASKARETARRVVTNIG
jgi:hypothetical protein